MLQECVATQQSLQKSVKTQKPGFRLVLDKHAADIYCYIDLMNAMKAQLPYVVGVQEMDVTHVTMKHRCFVLDLAIRRLRVPQKIGARSDQSTSYPRLQPKAAPMTPQSAWTRLAKIVHPPR
uniref:DNA-directed DNA polymerase n=1 Tax=Panagrellus redivivus TaxID=6233 RepID=A0A7E4V9Z2_PANRE